MNDAGAFVLLGVLHVVALAGCAALFAYALSGGDARDDRGGGDDAGGGGALGPPTPPAGGPPLPGARPSSVRMREPGRLADRVSATPRRPARESERRAPVGRSSRGRRRGTAHRPTGGAG